MFYIFLSGNKAKEVSIKKSLASKSIDREKTQLKNLLESKENDLEMKVVKATIIKKELIGEVNYLPRMRKVVKVFYRAVNQLKPYFLADVYYKNQAKAVVSLGEGTTTNIKLRN